MKFLIDECLSPTLAELARESGFEQSTHVTWLGLASKEDWVLTRRAVDEGFVLVTNNTVDFTVLYGREKLHVGLVCLNVPHGTMNLRVQQQLFQLMLEQLAEGEPYNEVLDLTVSTSGSVVVDRYPLPSD